MQFKVIKLAKHFAYSHKIELNEYFTRERDAILLWLREFEIPATVVGSSIYLDEQDLNLFLLRWS